MAGKIRSVWVTVSYYNVRPPVNLISLLRSLQAINAGWPFTARVIVNQGVPGILKLPQDLGKIAVYHRRNSGFNLGAWNYGWRIPPPGDAYLFLQDECRIVRENWLGASVEAAADPTVGLLGERLATDWDAPWDELANRTKGDQLPEHLIDGQPAERVPCYLDFFRRHNIPAGSKGDHLQSLVLFARREVLEAIGGFPIGRNYGEAIAAEIGISKKVQALGLSIRQVGPEPFTYIDHPEWLHRHSERRSP